MESDLELWEASAAGWTETIDRGESNRAFIDPFVWEALGEVAGTKVLDLGCGEGRFGRLLAARGARVYGVEPTPSLCARARDRGGYLSVEQASATELPYGDGEFDTVVAYLVLIDIRDFRAAIGEAFRVLRPGGRFLVPNITPFRSASTRYWLRDEAGTKLAWTVEFYGEEREELLNWKNIRIRNYHRPLGAYFDAYLGAGFVIERYQELIPSEEFVRSNPSFADERMAPNFDLAVLRKPA